jgi:hypothetical protein
MNWFTNLRLLAFIRRGVVALESLADSQRTIAKLAQDQWEKENAPIRRQPAVFGTLDQSAIDKRRKAQREAQGVLVAEGDE